MGKVVNLSWSSHAQAFTTGIWDLFKEKYKTDFEVSLNGSYISTHQLILAVFCPSIKNSSNTTLILGENSTINQQDLDTVIEFLYRGEVNLCEDRLTCVKNVADQLGFKVLSELITQSAQTEGKQLTIKKKSIKSESVQEDIVYKSNIRIMPDRLRKKRMNTRYSSKITEFIKLPSKTVATLKGLSKNPTLTAKVSPRSGLKRSANEDVLVVDSSMNVENTDSLETNVTDVTETDPDGANTKPYKRGPRRRDDLCLESFDPQTFEFICKQCSKGFAKANDLYNHLRVHEQPKIRYECQHCDYKTNNRTCFSGHMINRHQMDMYGNLRPKDLKCPQCSYMCSVNFQLKNHIYLVHSVKKKVCDACGYRCQSKATLEKHKRLVHSNAKPLMCETCGYRAKIFADLHRHMRVHFCSKVTCDICGASVSANHLSVHKKIHSSNPKPFACHLCTFTSWKNWNLKVHLKSVHQKDVDRHKLELAN